MKNNKTTNNNHSTYQTWFTQQIEQAIRAAQNSNHLIDHADIKAKWEAKRGQITHEK